MEDVQKAKHQVFSSLYSESNSSFGEDHEERWNLDIVLHSLPSIVVVVVVVARSTRSIEDSFEDVQTFVHIHHIHRKDWIVFAVAVVRAYEGHTDSEEDIHTVAEEPREDQKRELRYSRCSPFQIEWLDTILFEVELVLHSVDALYRKILH